MKSSSMQRTSVDQRITEHLAERVCGWHKETISLGRVACKIWRDSDGMFVRVSDFAPLTRPDDTSIVMEAWNKGPRELTIASCEGDDMWHAWAGDMNNDEILAGDGHSTCWTRAVCEAIFAASGGKEE